MKTSRNLCLMSLATVLVTVGMAHAVVIDGVQVRTGIIPVVPAGGASLPSRSFDILIRFDTTPQPCTFCNTEAITDEYETQGVMFSGPASGSGGSVLDECGNFGVSGHSPPNFLAFNCGGYYPDGGVPAGPERLDFSLPVTTVSALVGSGWGSSGMHLSLRAYDSAGDPIDDDVVTLARALQEISVSGQNIAYVIFGDLQDPCVWVMDDLGFNIGSPATQVAVDIKPGSVQNPINCGACPGVIPVALLTTDLFDAMTVDHTTVRFGQGAAPEAHVNKHGPIRHAEDVDGDGDSDLVFHFRLPETGIQCGDTEVTLTGVTYDGQPIIGTDTIMTVGGADRSLALERGIVITPNPFNPQTTVRFEVSVDERVTLRVFDVRGALVRTLVDADLSLGTHQATWDGRDGSGRGMASGSYFARLETGGMVETVRMILVR